MNRVEEPDELGELLEQVNSRETFFEFVRALIADGERVAERTAQEPLPPYGPHAGGWENATLDTYLEAALAWAEATKMGVRQGLSEEPSWREFAVFLYAGRSYE